MIINIREARHTRRIDTIMLIACLAILMVFYQIGVDGECCSSEKLDFVCKYIPYGTAKKPEKFCCCKDCTKPANGGYT
uniref:Uncharacterized protein n=1 Tax=Romanomermis culicivorax TaxID=13658 RepID=A0A915HJ55_ROMCU